MNVLPKDMMDLLPHSGEVRPGIKVWSREPLWIPHGWGTMHRWWHRVAPEWLITDGRTGWTRRPRWPTGVYMYASVTLFELPALQLGTRLGKFLRAAVIMHLCHVTRRHWGILHVVAL